MFHHAFYKYGSSLGPNDDEHSLSNLNESGELSNNSEELNDDATAVDDDDDDDDEDTWYSYMMRALRSKAYSLIGIERLNAPIKKTKFLRRKFSLLHMKSTTPGELYERKLDAEEYGEALHLARAYHLDADLVYQKQWRSKPITESSIRDYLSKIKKRSWILHECEEKVPGNVDTAKILIELGLSGTDLDALIAIKDKDDNRFYVSKGNEDEWDETPVDKFNTQQMARRRKRIEEIQREKLKLIDVQNLTLMQKELCATRIKLLTYLDRLKLYELILGGPLKAKELFDSEKYKAIRSKSILEVTLDYARVISLKTYLDSIWYYGFMI